MGQLEVHQLFYGNKLIELAKDKHRGTVFLSTKLRKEIAANNNLHPIKDAEHALFYTQKNPQKRIHSQHTHTVLSAPFFAIWVSKEQVVTADGVALLQCSVLRVLAYLC